MSAVHLISLTAASYLAPFVSGRFELGRGWVGAQVDFLPALLVYAALNGGLGGLAIVAVSGGLLFDSLSGNPAGVSTISLMLAGLSLRHSRELVLRDAPYAQGLIGAAVGAAVPLTSWVLQAALGGNPLAGWGTLVQLAFLAGTSGLATPLIIRLLDRIERTFGYPRMNESSFRADREIKRGRA